MTSQDLDIVTCGNKSAADFITAFVNYCHMLDDIKDEPAKVDDERMIGETLRFLKCLTLNAWVAQYQVPIMALISVSFTAWLDSNKWEATGTDIQKRDVDILKGMYHEVVWYIAEQCGGYDHARAITIKYREYDHDSITKETK